MFAIPKTPARSDVETALSNTVTSNKRPGRSDPYSEQGQAKKQKVGGTLSQLESLPDEMQLKIMEHLDVSSLMSILATSKSLDRLRPDAMKIIAEDRTLRATDTNKLALLIQAVPQMRHLIASGLQLKADDVKTHISKLPLRSLDLSKNAIEDEGIQHIAASTLKESLEELNVSDNGITDQGGKSITGFPKLKSLDISENGNQDEYHIYDISDVTSDSITATTAEYVARNPALRKLNFCSNYIGDAGAHHIANSSLKDTLEELNVCGNFLEDEGGIAIGSCRNLKKLDISVNYLVSTSAFEAIAQIAPLEELEASRCEVTYDGAKALYDHSKLNRIDITETQGSYEIYGYETEEIYMRQPGQSWADAGWVLEEPDSDGDELTGA